MIVFMLFLNWFSTFKKMHRFLIRASLVAQRIKNLPAMQETQALSLGQEDPCRREWQSTPVFLPGEFHGQWTQVGYSLWCCKQLDTTERLTLLLTDKGCYSYTVLK